MAVRTAVPQDIAAIKSLLKSVPDVWQAQSPRDSLKA